MNTEIETLTQELEIIKSTFLPQEKLEDTTTNVDEWLEFTKNNRVDEWLEFTKNSRINALKPNEVIFDYEIIKNAEAFALGPVFIYNGKMEACSTLEYDCFDALKDHLNGKKYILYYVTFLLKTAEVDKESFTLKPLDKPEIRYTFRGHILE